MGAINNIQNGEQGLSARKKLNILTDFYNNFVISDSAYTLLRFDASKIKAAAPVGNFLRDDGTFAAVSSGWAFNGNSEGSLKYFGTNDNFDIPIYTNGIVRGVFDKVGNFGFGLAAALSTSRVTIRGTDNLDTAYSLITQNQGEFTLFSLSNSGAMYAARQNAGSTLTLRGGYSNNNNLTLKLGSSNPGISFDSSLDYPGVNWSIIKGYNNANDLEFLYGNNLNSNPTTTAIYLKGVNGYVGLGLTTPLARLHVRGNSDNLTDYALIVDGQSIPNKLLVTNEGETCLNGFPFSNFIDGGKNAVFQSNQVAHFQHYGRNLTFATSTVYGLVLGIDNDDSNAYAGTYSEHDFRIRTNNTNVIAVTSLGNMGIGVMSPSSARLSIVPFTTKAHLNLKKDTTATSNIDGDFAYDGTNLIFQMGSTKYKILLEVLI